MATSQLPSTSASKTTIDCKFVMIIGSFIENDATQTRNAPSPYFKAMNKFNSVYNSMNKMKKIEFPTWKRERSRCDRNRNRMKPKLDADAIRHAMASHSIYDYRNVFTLKTEGTRQRQFGLCLPNRAEQSRAHTSDPADGSVNDANSYTVYCVCVYVKE